jgi:putative ABC transport system ATP-binding protein
MEALLQIRDLHHAFGSGDTRRTVLHGVSAEIHPGEIVLLTGPSGAGKTTILTIAGGLRSVQAGSVRVFGRELYGAGKPELLSVRRRIGFIFQNPNLIASLSSWQNVALPLSWSGPVDAASVRQQAMAQLRLVGLEDHADKSPDQLSGGQRQRVAIARALVVQPGLILADEPTSALDRRTGREVVLLLQQLAQRQKCAILLVTHDHRILDIADRTLSLEDGRLVSRARDAVQVAGQLTAGVSRLGRPALMARELETLDEPSFFRFLEESTDELTELRRALDAARNQVASARFDRLLVATTIRTGQFLNAERVTLFVVDWAAGKLRSRVAQAGTDDLLSIEMDLHRGIAGQVARTGIPVRLRDAYDSPEFNPEVDQRTGYRTRSLLCLPVRRPSGEVIAVAQVLNKRDAGEFTADDEDRFREFLEPIGRLVGDLLALEHPETRQAGEAADATSSKNRE